MRKDYRYEVIENHFHGGKHIAYAISLEAAVRSAKRHDTCTGRYCCCGGPAIRNADGTCLSEDDQVKLLALRYGM